MNIVFTKFVILSSTKTETSLITIKLSLIFFLLDNIVVV